MIYSITFKNDVVGERNTLTDFHLYHVKRPNMGTAEPDFNFLELPALDGHLDLTEALDQQIHYKPREGSWTFRYFGTLGNAATIASNIQNYLQGQQMKIILSDEPNFYWTGRVWLSDVKYKKAEQVADFVISYIVDPYRYDVIASDEPWVWDTFDFTGGTIRQYYDIELTNGLEYTIVGSVRPVTPAFVISDMTATSIHMIIGDKSYELHNGANIFPFLKIYGGETTLHFAVEGGTAKLAISFRGSML